MPTKKTVSKKELENIENIEEPEIEEDEVKAPKNDRFFTDADLFQSFLVTVYKVEKHGKRVFIDDYTDYIPDIKEIRELYGGGTYEFYAFEIRDGKKLSHVIDTKQVHVADIATNKPIAQTQSKKELLEEIKI